MDNRNTAIDSLKGIAIIGVFATHFFQFFKAPFGGGGIISDIIGNGARGVQLMFVINGFLISASLEKNRNTKQWIIHKLLRLMPAYWIATIAYILLFPMGNEYYLAGKGLETWNILFNLLGIHGLAPWSINSINLNWFVADIFVWYLVAPFIYKYLNSVTKLCKVLYIYIPCFGIFDWLIQKIQTDYVSAQYFDYFWFPAQFPAILLGMLVWKIYEEREKIEIKRNVLFSMVFLAFATIANLIHPTFFDINIYSFTLSWSIPFAILLLWCVECPNIISANKIFAFFGRYSYGIYLSHYLIIRFLSEKFKVYEKVDGSAAGIFLLFSLVLVFTCVIGIIFEKMNELIVFKVKSKQ